MNTYNTILGSCVVVLGVLVLWCTYPSLRRRHGSFAESQLFVNRREIPEAIFFLLNVCVVSFAAADEQGKQLVVCVLVCRRRWKKVF